MRASPAHCRGAVCLLTLITAACCSGKCATCNPISEPDLAAALVDTIADKSKENLVWNLGGPDEGLSMRQQGELVADVLGKEEAKLLGVPIGIFDFIINGLQFLGARLARNAAVR